jgi:hypothetical protein
VRTDGREVSTRTEWSDRLAEALRDRREAGVMMAADLKVPGPPPRLFAATKV